MNARLLWLAFVLFAAPTALDEAKLLVAAVVLLPALLILGVVLGVRRLRRRRTARVEQTRRDSLWIGDRATMVRIEEA